SYLPSFKLYEYMDMRRHIEGWVDVLDFSGGRQQLVGKMDLEGINFEKQKAFRYYEETKAQIADLKKKAEAKNARLVFVAFPTKLAMYQWLFEPKMKKRVSSDRPQLNLLQKISAELGIPFIGMELRLKPAAREAYEKLGEFFWFSDDTHMNPEGAHLSGKII